LSVRVDETKWIGDLRVVAVENEHIRLTILPGLGAKIYDIVHKGSGKNILWHNPRIRPRRVPFGSRFDDVWSGGWDEIFPNDAESIIEGERYPDMGEVWSLEWDYQVSQGRDWASVTTTVRAPITPAEISRKLTLRKGVSGFVLEYVISNMGRNPIQFLWKVHPAFEISRNCRIEIPAEHGTVDGRYAHLFSRRKYRWPMARGKAGEPIDVSVVDRDANNCTLHYITGLRKGSAGFIDYENDLASTLEFPRSTMDNVWLFLAYGGWRGHYTAVIEPSTSYPYDLAEAVRRGQVARLKGGGSLSTKLGFRVNSAKRNRNRISNRAQRTGG
jgi:hypothetical protein